MKNKKLFSLLLAASMLAAMSGCVGSVVYLDENGNPTNPPASSTAASSAPEASTAGDEESEEESTEEESTAEESKAEESTAEESTAEESKAEESAAEESTAEESKAEESAAEESTAEESKAEGIKITFTKPEKWGDDVCAYVFGDGDVKNAEWPGEEMTNNGDGTFSYIVPSDIPNPKVVFNYNGGKRQYPRSGGLDVTDGGSYTTE